MNTIKTLLVPVDFSPHSLVALREAAALARQHGAELLLLHVIEEVDTFMQRALHQTGLGTLGEEVEKTTLGLLGKLQAEHLAGLRAELLVRRGLPSATIVATATERHVDAIVIATLGRTGLAHLVLGSTTERVLRTADCSVLVVRKGVEGAYRRLLVPLDFSERAEEALPVAAQLAARTKGRLQLLHAIGELPWMAQEALKSGRFPALQQELHRSAKERLQQLRERLAKTGVECETYVVDSGVDDKIVEFARTNSVDLIVMTTAGHTGVKHFVLGSTTEKVVRTAPCSVLVVRGARKAAATK
jgi:nucleotide-binding universal stress UspA family protein